MGKKLLAWNQNVNIPKFANPTLFWGYDKIYGNLNNSMLSLIKLITGKSLANFDILVQLAQV